MDTILGNQINSSWQEADQLISILRQWGIHYLVGDAAISIFARGTEHTSAVSLILRLAQCEYPRVRDASISLFLLHPELAPAVLEALQTSEAMVVEQIAILTLATVYLQRLWSFRLTFALGHPPTFPAQPFASLWCDRRLPPPAYHDGAWGLVALDKYAQEQSGFPFNYRGD